MPNKKEKIAVKDKVDETAEKLFFMDDLQIDEKINDSFEEKRESLLVLATLGMTKEIGVEKIYKLPGKSVEKVFNRYQRVQRVQGKKVSEVLYKKEQN